MKLHASLFGFVLAVAVAASGCGPMDPAGEDAAGFDVFETALAKDGDFDIYWLGRSFDAAGVVFEGPFVDDFGDEVEGGRLAMDYLQTPCCSGLKVTLYSPDAWDKIVGIRAAQPQGDFSSEIVNVNGEEAELRSYRGGVELISSFILVVEFDGTFIEARAAALVPATPGGSQPNPLMDREVFLAVMENLRPYPD